MGILQDLFQVEGDVPTSTTNNRGTRKLAPYRVSREHEMKARRLRRLSVVGLAAALAPVLALGAASASSAAVRSPSHEGNPRVWGPPLGQLCSSPAMAAAAGYTVFVLTNSADNFTGTPGPDAIYALGGNDTIRGGEGDDVICLGFGHDKGRGNAGNDAVFGEAHNDALQGDTGRDYLNGGTQQDSCDGGPALDAAALCDVVVAVP